MLIGVLSAHSWTQAQNSPPTNEVMIDIDTTASWEKIKKKKTHLALKTNLLYAATLTPNLGLESAAIIHGTVKGKKAIMTSWYIG